MRLQTGRAQRGMVLISALLLLVVVTVLAIAMFRSYGIQERIAGNVREKERALHAANLAEQFAEYWLTRDNNATLAPIQCTEQLNAVLNQGAICSNIMSLTHAGAALSPLGAWDNGDKDNPVSLGVLYMPTLGAGSVDMHLNSSVDSKSWETTGGTYFQEPRFYISDLGTSAIPGVPGEIFQIDAKGWGTTANAVAIVESTFVVGPEVVNLGGL